MYANLFTIWRCQCLCEQLKQDKNHYIKLPLNHIKLLLCGDCVAGWEALSTAWQWNVSSSGLSDRQDATRRWVSTTARITHTPPSVNTRHKAHYAKSSSTLFQWQYFYSLAPGTCRQHECEQTEQICIEMQRISGKTSIERATVIQQHVGSKWLALFAEQTETK